MIACPICSQPLKAGRCACPEQPITVRRGKPAAPLDFVPCSAWVGPLEEAADYIAELAKDMEAAGIVAMGCNLHAAEQAMRAAIVWAKESGPTIVLSNPELLK